MVHLKGYMYKWIMQDLGKKQLPLFSALVLNLHVAAQTQPHFASFSLTDKFILRKEETDAVLHRLVSQGKKLFLITNSPFSFV